MGRTAIVGLGRDDPDIVGDVRRDLLQHVEPGRFDAIVIGDQDAHFLESFPVRPEDSSRLESYY
ncbi:hypothetical protein AUC68_07195 [Methyloceanibacter methanicus]|uniref:Uncharacterized protein n=1 Tax=Methyloceanibacter methanicus TaxID=1774968 RepID=A0A1E3W0A4_9HYPH|nr:hypothetical protein [Methyloceanibacter methanicus]ODR98941.1 hypothetical protein AUC68_07195 [Methyloceanibacter methanicus]